MPLEHWRGSIHVILRGPLFLSLEFHLVQFYTHIMKNIIFLLSAFQTLILSVMADELIILTPYAQTVWKSGEKSTVSWDFKETTVTEKNIILFNFILEWRIDRYSRY
jgi:hypothetical protein